MEITIPQGIGEVLNQDTPETTREETGYRTTTQEKKNQAMTKFYAIKRGLKNSRQKSPVCRIQLRLDGKIYKYSFAIADELIKTGKATLIEIL